MTRKRTNDVEMRDVHETLEERVQRLELMVENHQQDLTVMWKLIQDFEGYVIQIKHGINEQFTRVYGYLHHVVEYGRQAKEHLLPAHPIQHYV